MKQTPTTPPVPDNFPRPLRTLVVDDSVLLMKSLCAYLRTQPLFEVVGTAVDGKEALRMAEWLQPDLVLMDLHMPVMNGLQATAILRRRMHNMRIIIMTMEDSATTEAEARAHGAHGFIGKPRIIDDHLMAEVRRAFYPDYTKDDQSSSWAYPNCVGLNASHNMSAHELSHRIKRAETNG
ncbi:MAG: response regulator [Verrucomicrobia bacterium]|nr:response regulator [Verrucomicrobiota bacterium]